jgi:hypothetical protein
MLWAAGRVCLQLGLEREIINLHPKINCYFNVTQILEFGGFFLTTCTEKVDMRFHEIM